MESVHFEIGETSVTIKSEKEYFDVAKKAIYDARETILKKIEDDVFFKTTFEPYPVSESDDRLIRRMCEASALANVGPMAGVAGAVACCAVERMSEAGAEFAIVENGGDIAMKIDRDVVIGLFAGKNKISKIGFMVKKRKGIFGICSSSGKIGPSISLGDSDICTVISENVILADCCATSLGNLIGEGGRERMASALEIIGGIDGVEGCLASCGGLVAMDGDLPELVKCDSGRHDRYDF